MTREIILIAGAYLLGSIPTGLLLAKAAGVDIRAAGSGNIGATNVYRTLGRTVGVLTLVGDCLKGLLPVLAARYLGLTDAWIAAAGLAAFLGHVYTVFLGFKGGKGVATALGVFLGVSPLAVLGALAIFVLLVWKWRYISLGSISAAAAMPILVALLDRRPELVGMTVVVAALVIWKHRENIGRLRDGTENRFKA
ncbi:glycerol-3-phosphate 1-O-acyltransferase PlsY [Geobacter argillaceus]|uniref:Glycerol-3-phosphate acyltransferase n=1 Tax=Geobacter argillaceus TaxID=345631 RepID=A0A562WQ83_9BACT|nr:glycerol-3-phosphate 1-O-acyltransferase PlsY [Geobacter argillaceus]TWJ32469.1 acyl-phosphate glycerol-3-phosphate acyltransferase [Geobacter argillaceus]